MDTVLLMCIGGALVGIAILAGVAYALNSQDPDNDFNTIMAIGSPVILAIAGGANFMLGGSSSGNTNKNNNTRTRHA